MKQTYKSFLLGFGLAFLMALGWAIALTGPVRAQTAAHGIERAETLAVYGAFKEARNARDMDAIGSFFIDGPEFFWVSDGRSVWGREPVLARMGRFQKAEVWRVHPDLDNAEVIELGAGLAILHMPLVL